MEKLAILSLCMLLLLLASPLTMAQQDSCTDSDGGKDFFVAGEVIFSSVVDGTTQRSTLQDWCRPVSKELLEAFCVNSTMYAYPGENYDCPYGCKNGACLSTPPGCLESDAQNQDAQGDILGIPLCADQSACTEYVAGLDHCEPDPSIPNHNEAIESYAKIESRCVDGEHFAEERVPCPNGCRGGVCLSAPPTCTDSDGGANAATKGKAVYTNNPFLTEQPDYCESDHYLIESVCNTQTSYLQNKQKFFCPNGCFDGRCIEGALPTTGAPPSAQGSSCTDSDGGADYAAAGTASYANNPEIGSQSDSCSDGNELNERVCNSQTDYRKNTQVVYCHNGCSGGACAPNPVLTTPYCDDSDGGNIAGTKGTAQALAPCIGQQNCYVLTSETDACDGSSLMEFYCSGVERRSKGATCQYGCANGACRPSPSQTQQSSGGGGGVPLEIYTPPAPAQNESAAKHLGCSDSDSGVDLSVSGSARDGEQAFTDECAPCGARSCVREAVCTDDEEAMLLTYECAAGCADGACIAVVSCSDSDGGESFVVAGTASVLADGTPQRTASDQCVLNGQAVVSCAGDGCLLDEMSCSGSDIHSTSYPCPSGCADGACVDSTCTDSDGGIAPRTRGSASALGALHYDACIDAEGRQVDRCSRCSVREYACTPEGTRFEDMPCPFGCSDGACTERTTDLATGNVVAGPLPLTAPKQDPQKILNQVRAINTDIEEGDVCTGCLLDDACVPEGVRLLGASDGPLFCGGGSMLAQKAAGSACSLDYECASNACAQGVCAGVAQATGDEGWFGIFTI